MTSELLTSTAYPAICCCRNKGAQFGQGQAEFVTNGAGNGWGEQGELWARWAGVPGCPKQVRTPVPAATSAPRTFSLCSIQILPLPSAAPCWVSQGGEGAGEEQLEQGHGPGNTDRNHIRASECDFGKSCCSCSCHGICAGSEIFKKSKRSIIAVGQLIILFFLFV